MRERFFKQPLKVEGIELKPIHREEKTGTGEPEAPVAPSKEHVKELKYENTNVDELEKPRPDPNIKEPQKEIEDFGLIPGPNKDSKKIQYGKPTTIKPEERVAKSKRPEEHVKELKYEPENEESEAGEGSEFTPKDEKKESPKRINPFMSMDVYMANPLSEDYQEFIIKKTSKAVLDLISKAYKELETNYLQDLKENNKLPNPELHELHLLKQEIEDLTTKFLEKIKEEKSQDSRLILEFLREGAKIFARADSNPDIKLSKRIKEIFKVAEEKYKEFLKYAAEFHIYKIKIPMEIYKKITTEKVDLAHRSPAQITADMITSGLTLAIMPVVGFFITFLPPNNFGQDAADKAHAREIQATRSFWNSEVGFKYRGNFPTEWIEGVVEFRPDHMLEADDPREYLVTKENQEYKKSPNLQTKTLFIVSGQSPESIFKFGTNYLFDSNNPLFNPHGANMIFYEGRLARRYLLDMQDGRHYDIAGGWQESPWTAEERNEVRQNLAKQIVEYLKDYPQLSGADLSSAMELTTEYAVPGVLRK